MAITVKTPEEIQIMREGGKILAFILQELKKYAEIGRSTKELTQYADKLMEKYKVKPSFKGYQGFPATLCTSINEEVVHTIPGERRLKDGDILTIDCGVFYKGFHSDSAITILVGNVKEPVKEFVYVVKKALDTALSKIKPGTNLNVIGETIQKIVEVKHAYSVIKDLTGHGIGRQLHEDPYIVNYKESNPGPVLQEGMTFAVEPIVAMGSERTITLDDNWTIVTEDKLPACQWEHTVAVTNNGVEILTV